MPTSNRSAQSKKIYTAKLSLALYRSMLQIRRAEEKIAEIYPSDKIQSPVHLCIGQEAVSAGVCFALERTDHLYGTYRSHGIYLAKGGDIKKLFAELYGKDTGCSRGKGGSMHLVAPEVGLMGCSAIVASTIPVATGDALASDMQGRKRVVVALFGDGAVDEGVFFESLNFAALKNLPIVYVLENNHYAIHSKIKDRHKQTNLFRIGEGVGLSGRQFEGNDVRTVFNTMTEAVEDVRAGAPPLLIEYLTYRRHEHVGPALDHNEKYRDQQKLTHAAQHDPLEITCQALINEFYTPPADLRKIEEEIKAEIEEAVQFAESSRFPYPEQLYEGLFAETS